MSAAIPIQAVYPAVKSVNIAPTKLAPGRGLSSRSRVDIQLIDFTDNDLQTDPYAADRNYIASDQGTFFGKLFARNPHYVGRALRVKLGYFNDDGSAEVGAILIEFIITLSTASTAQMPTAL